MSVDSQSQMEAIQAMMDQGQRSVYMERHTWLIWGLSAALLIVFLEFVFADIKIEQWLHNIFETLIIIAVLTIAGITDFRLTKKARRQRDETISFVQIQVTKIWWFLVGLIIFINLGMNFFGGGYIFYPILIVILGLAFYMHGLFSKHMYCWLGMGLIMMAAAALALQAPFFFMRWLALFVLAFGFPFVAAIQDRPIFNRAQWPHKLFLLAVFVIVTVAPAILALKLSTASMFGAPTVVSLEEYKALPEDDKHAVHYVRFPSGYVFDFVLQFEGNLFAGNNVSVNIPVPIANSMDIAFKEGHALGYFRLADDTNKSFLWIRSDAKTSTFSIDKELTILKKFTVEAKQ